MFVCMVHTDVFQHDPDYEENEKKYQIIKEEILGGDSDNEGKVVHERERRQKWVEGGCVGWGGGGGGRNGGGVTSN